MDGVKVWVILSPAEVAWLAQDGDRTIGVRAEDGTDVRVSSFAPVDGGPVPGEDFDPQQDHDERMQQAADDEQRYAGGEG